MKESRLRFTAVRERPCLQVRLALRLFKLDLTVSVDMNRSNQKLVDVVHRFYIHIHFWLTNPTVLKRRRLLGHAGKDKGDEEPRDVHWSPRMDSSMLHARTTECTFESSRGPKQWAGSTLQYPL